MNLNANNTRKESFFSILLLVCLGNIASAQSPSSIECNQTVYANKQYIKDLPSYICIPDGNVIDDYVRTSDRNRDGTLDFLAIKYNRKQDDQHDGDTTYWLFYSRKSGGEKFEIQSRLSNLTPPYIKRLNLTYITTHQIAEYLYINYPFRLSSHELSFQLRSDTIKLRYKLDDTYGKSFVFIFNPKENDWFLEFVEYFIGELPKYWWDDDEFYYALADEIKIIEVLRPKESVSILNFDLKEACRYREEEIVHLSELHIDLISSKHGSIKTYEFKPCMKSFQAKEWKY